MNTPLINLRRYEIYNDCTALYQPNYHSFEVSLGKDQIPFFSVKQIDAMLDGMVKIANGELDCSDNLRLFVLRSDYKGIFNLGADLEMFYFLARNKRRLELLDYAYKCVQLIHYLHSGINSAIPTISLVEGVCAGGGFEAALACDYLIATESSTFSFPEIKLGIFPGMGAASILSRTLGKGVFQRVLLSGDIFSAHQLFDMGLINQVIPDGAGESALRNLIKNMNSPAYKEIAHIYKVHKSVPLSEMHFFAEKWVDMIISLSQRQLSLIAYAATQQKEK